MPFNKLVLFVVLLVFSQLSLSAACPASSDTTTAGNGDCTITGGASTIQLNFTSGFDSSTTVTAVDGNNGTTLGAQRKLSFIKAAEIISEQVTSTVTIIVEANFSALSCTTNSAVLGSAGATANLSISSSPPAGIIANTNYPIGLYNAITGSDVSGAHDDIDANFNSDIGDADCLASSSWYYGFSDASGTEIGFTTVLLHEMTHGLGFASLVDPSDGSQSGGIDDIFSANLYDNVTGRSWNDNSQTDQNREDSAISVDDLLWSGTNVNTNAIGLLTNGFNDVDTDGNFESGDQIEMYAPASVESGSSVSHFTTDATPNELMEPSYTDSLYSLGLSLYLLEDIGWTIVEPNNAPTITAVDQTTSEDNAIVVDISGWGNDADSDSLTYSVTSCATNITCSLTGTNLTLTPDSNHNGATHTITVKVDDGTDNNSDSFNLNVTAQNDAPTWSTISEQNTNEDNDLVIDLSTYSNDVDGDTLTYSVSSCATNITCSVSGDNLTLSPTANYSGATHNITVEVDDSTASAVSTSFNLVVNAQNDAPTWSAIPDQSIDDGDNVVINLNTYASDIDGDSLDYTATSCGANLTCSISSNTLTVSASGGSGSTVSVTIEADDNNGGTNSDTFDVTITTPANNAPTITAVDQTTTEDNAIVVDISAWGNDADGDGLTYSVTSCASNITCSLSGTNLTLTPDSNHNGATHSITIKVDDGTDNTSDTFNFNVGAENDAPTWSAIPDQSIDDGDNVVINLNTYASDIDGDSLDYTATSCGANLTCSISSNTLTVSASGGSGSTVSVTIEADDNNGGTNSDTFDVTITTPANNAPTITAVDQTTTEDNAIVVDISAWGSDADGDGLTYSVTSCASNITCSLSGTSLTLTPDTGHSGATHNITIEVDDTNGGTASDSFNLEVTAENDAPTITATDQTTSEDTTLVVDISTWGSDADNDSLSYSLSSCADNITCTLTGTSLSLTPSANHHGSSHSMTIQVSDPDGANASGTFNLNVVSINDTPIFSDMDDINLIEGDSYSLDLLDFATDIDGDALSFSLLSCPTALVCNLINSSLSLQANSGAGSSVQVSVQALDANGASVSKIVNVNIRAFSASTYIEVGGTRYDHNDTLSIPASDINISVLGGSGDYEYQLNYLDGDVNNLIESDASDLTLQMPDTGSFAGQYTLSITDTSNSETIVVTLIRPIRLVWSASDLLSGDNSQEIVIEGGEVGSQYSLAQLQDTLLTFKDTDGTVQTQFTASDDQDSFNGAKVKIEVGIVTILTDLEVTVSTLNNTYEDDTTELQVYPAIEHHIQVMDTNTTPIPQASAELSATTLLTQLNLPVDYSADENGEMIIRLPDTQAVNQLTIQSNQFNPATLMLDESLTEHQVILTALSQFITLTGSISALGTQNFVSHPPQVLLDFEDGSIDSVTVSVSNSSQASFSHDVDINSRSLTNMRVIQADSLNIELDISSLSQNQTYNILLERSIAVVVSTPSSDSGGGPLNLLILLGLMFTLIPRKQSWQA